MSVNAAIVQIMIDAGMGGEEILVVAKGMERGPTAAIIFKMVDSLIEAQCPNEAIAIAVFEVAQNTYPTPRPVGPKRDSNKARRGLSHKKWAKIRHRILERDEWACRYCGSDDDLTCDHVVPLARGGGNDDENLVAACRSCNSSKCDKLLSEWGGPIQ